MAESEDSFDKLLSALKDAKFEFPYRVTMQKYYNCATFVEAQRRAREDNRHALITALTNSGWLAQ